MLCTLGPYPRLHEVRSDIIFLYVVQYKIRKLQIPWGHFYLTEPSYYYVELGIEVLYPTASARMLKFSFTATKSQSVSSNWVALRKVLDL